MDPVIRFFLPGLAAGLAKLKLRLPSAVHEFVGILLLLSIGLKAGVELVHPPFPVLLPEIRAAIAMGVFLPLAALSALLLFGEIASLRPEKCQR